jgi:hypothetical protein
MAEQKRIAIVFPSAGTLHTPTTHLDPFTKDALIDYPKDGPGWIKADLRRVVGRMLDKLGA